MNYIKQLQQESNDYAHRLNRLDYEIVDFMRFLQSSKFHDDTTIQTHDVQSKLQTFRNIVLDLNNQEG